MRIYQYRLIDLLLVKFIQKIKMLKVSNYEVAELTKEVDLFKKLISKEGFLNTKMVRFASNDWLQVKNVKVAEIIIPAKADFIIIMSTKSDMYLVRQNQLISYNFTKNGCVELIMSSKSEVL